jgi:hypothetical protein
MDEKVHIVLLDWDPENPIMPKATIKNIAAWLKGTPFDVHFPETSLMNLSPKECANLSKTKYRREIPVLSADRVLTFIRSELSSKGKVLILTGHLLCRESSADRVVGGLTRRDKDVCIAKVIIFQTFGPP